jgi:hypothetical protein
VALANMGEVARLDGRYDTAIGLCRRALPPLATVGDPGHRVRARGTVGLALAESGATEEADAVRVAMADLGAAAAGTRALIGGYVALARAERAHAVKLFDDAAESLRGHRDARDVVEAMVGVVASTDGPADREAARARLTEVCQRTGVVLLPRDLALLTG